MSETQTLVAVLPNSENLSSMREIPDVPSDPKMKLLEMDRCCFPTIPRQPIKTLPEEKVAFNVSTGQFQSCCGLCIQETARETLVITHKKMIFSRRKHMPCKCCAFTLCNTTVETTNERKTEDYNGLVWSQFYGDRVCTIMSPPSPNNLMEALCFCNALSQCIAETISANCRLKCCQVDNGRPVTFMFKNGSTETIRVPTADHLNTIRALEGYLAAPEKIEMQ